MKKKILPFSFLILLLIIFSGLCVYAESTFSTGSTEFNMPQGYYIGTPNDQDAINITDGSKSVFIYEHEDNNIEKYVNHYTKEGQKIKPTNYTIDNTVVFKANNNNKIHYWFIKNNKTYDVYIWEPNENIDSIVETLIKS